MPVVGIAVAAVVGVTVAGVAAAAGIAAVAAADTSVVAVECIEAAAAAVVWHASADSVAEIGMLAVAAGVLGFDFALVRGAAVTLVGYLTAAVLEPALVDSPDAAVDSAFVAVAAAADGSVFAAAAVADNTDVADSTARYEAQILGNFENTCTVR